MPDLEIAQNDMPYFDLIELQRARVDPKARLKSVSNVTRDVLNELEKTYKPEAKKEEKNEKADKFNAAHYSSGKVAASFTSTAMTRETIHEAAIIEEDVVRYSRVKKKGMQKHFIELSGFFAFIIMHAGPIVIS